MGATVTVQRSRTAEPIIVSERIGFIFVGSVNRLIRLSGVGLWGFVSEVRKSLLDHGTVGYRMPSWL
jgi:hypothetical protein